MKIELTEQNIWWMVLGIIIGVCAVNISDGKYWLLLFNLGAFTMVIILWRFIIWIMLKIGKIKTPTKMQ